MNESNKKLQNEDLEFNIRGENIKLFGLLYMQWFANFFQMKIVQLEWNNLVKALIGWLIMDTYLRKIMMKLSKIK